MQKVGNLCAATVALLSAFALNASIPAHPVTIDGDDSDWLGSLSVQLHDVIESAGEWIYTGEAGDVRTDPPDPGVRQNYDITEVRVTSDTEFLYFLVRFADVTDINEVHVVVGIDKDQDGMDTSLNFMGDESGLGYGAVSALMPEFLLSVHNAQPGITWVEYYDDDDGNGTVWYTPAGTESFISPANNLMEFRVRLDSLGLTDTSTIGVSVASFDNGNTAGDGVAFNNDEDTTIDYPVHDALDCIGGSIGVSENAFTRDLGDADLDYQFLITLPPGSASVACWSMINY